MKPTGKDPREGWTIKKDPDSGLMFVYRPDGTKYGQTQTPAAAKIMRRNARAATTVEESQS